MPMVAADRGGADPPGAGAAGGGGADRGRGQRPGGREAVPGVADVGERSLANRAKGDIIQLTALVKTRLRRMQYRPGLLTGFLAGTKLDLASLQ
jgi:hypothetical protein